MPNRPIDPPKQGGNRSAQRQKWPVRSLDTEEVVLTPGGLRPRRLVHILEPGQEVRVEGLRVRIIDSASGEVVKDLGESGSSADDSVTAPTLSKHRPVAVPADTGWIVYAQWGVSGASLPMIYFSTKWVVPRAPASNESQTVFLFNAMMPDSFSHIVQPVLQWGKSVAGGGNYWSIANWYAGADGGYAITKGPIQVNPGDVLQGVITCVGRSGAKYSYKCSFVGFESIDLMVPDIEQLTWAYETLECYRITQCSDYPDTPLTAMYDIEIKTGNPGSSGSDASLDWSPIKKFSDCGQECSIVSNNSPGGVVYLYYSQPTQFGRVVTARGNNGQLQVIGLGLNDRLPYLTWQDPNGNWLWAGSLVDTAVELSSIATGQGNGQLQVIGLGLNDNLPYLIRQDPSGTWHWAGKLADAAVKFSSIVTGSGNDGQLQVIGLGLNDHLPYLIWQDPSGTWHWQGNLIDTGVEFSSIATGLGNDDQLQVIGLGLNDHLPYLIWQDPSGTWHWQGEFIDTNVEFSSITMSPGNVAPLQVIGLGLNDQYPYLMWQDPNGAWNWVGKWTDPSVPFSSIAAGIGNDGQLQVIGLGLNNLAYLMWQDPRGAWHWGDLLPQA